MTVNKKIMTVNKKIIKNKVGLLKLAEELGTVSRACKIMGFSRDTFYRYKSAARRTRASVRSDRD